MAKYECTEVQNNALNLAKEFMTGNQPLESVQEDVYLGHLLTGEPTREKEIHLRKSMGWFTYSRHSQIMTGKLLLSLK